MDPETLKQYLDPFVVPCFPRLHLQPPPNDNAKNYLRILGALLSPDGSGDWVLPAIPNQFPSLTFTGFEPDPLDLEILDPRLIFAKSTCWKCRNEFEHVALAGRQLVDRFRGFSSRGDWVVARYVRKFEQQSWCHITGSTGSRIYRPTFSQTAGFEYFMNCCPECGAHQGDFPLIDQASGIFHRKSWEDLIKMDYKDLEVPVRFCGWFYIIRKVIEYHPKLLAPPFGKIYSRLQQERFFQVH